MNAIQNLLTVIAKEITIKSLVRHYQGIIYETEEEAIAAIH